MIEADPPMRAARNAFLVLITLLLGISTYQFVTINGLTRPIALLWGVSVVAYFASKFYYERVENRNSTTEETADETTANETTTDSN